MIKYVRTWCSTMEPFVLACSVAFKTAWPASGWKMTVSTSLASDMLTDRTDRCSRGSSRPTSSKRRKICEMLRKPIVAPVGREKLYVLCPLVYLNGTLCSLRYLLTPQSPRSQFYIVRIKVNQWSRVHTRVEGALLNIASRVAEAVGQPVVEAVLVARVMNLPSPVTDVIRVLPIEGMVVILGEQFDEA